MRHGLQTRIGLRPDGRPAGSDLAACRFDPPRLETQRPARRHGLGQDLHRGQRHRAAQPPDVGPEPQQDPRGAALRRIPQLLSRECRRVFRLLLRLLPARSLSPRLGHLHRKGSLDQRRHREAAAADRGHPALGTPRRGGRLERLVPLRRGQPGRFPCHGHPHRGGTGRQLQAVPLQAGRGALHPHGTRSGARDLPRQRRHGRYHGGLRRIRQPVLPGDVLRQRDRGHPVDRSRHGTAHPDARLADALPPRTSS